MASAGVILPRMVRSHPRRYLFPLVLWSMLAGGACATTSPPPSASPAVELEPGQSRSSILGCLATGGQDKGPSRALQESEADSISIRAKTGGALVTHAFAHPCCLEGDVRTAIDGEVVTLHERLTGEPCRCMCHSTMETMLGLAPGRWTIRVILEQPDGSPQMAHEKAVEVAGPRTEP
jgi:hypothetical protein